MPSYYCIYSLVLWRFCLLCLWPLLPSRSLSFFVLYSYFLHRLRSLCHYHQYWLPVPASFFFCYIPCFPFGVLLPASYFALLIMSMPGSGLFKFSILPDLLRLLVVYGTHLSPLYYLWSTPEPPLSDFLNSHTALPPPPPRRLLAVGNSPVAL